MATILRSWRMASRPASRAQLVQFLIDSIPLILIAVFSLAYIRLALANHFIFRTGEDLAHYGQALWHLSYGRLPYSSFKGFVLWGDHGHFILALLAPFYRLVPDVRALLYLQALAVTTSGFAVYKVAQALLKNKFFANAALFSYLSFIGIQYALNFDFHPSVLTGVAIAWALYALHFKKWYLYWVVVGLGLLTREDAGPIFFLLGVYIICTRRWKVGLATAALSLAAFLVIVYQLMPLWTPDNVALIYFDDDNKDFWHIVGNLAKYPHVYWENMFDTDIKRSTIHTLFASFGYLPLLSPFTYLTSASIFFSRFATGSDYRWALDNHSNANILPLLCFGAIYAASTIRRGVGKLVQKNTAKYQSVTAIILGIVLIVATLLNSWVKPAFPLRQLTAANQPITPIPAARAASFKEAVRTIITPDDAVSASAGLTADLSHRQEIYNFPGSEEKSDVIIVSLRINTWPLKRDEMAVAIAKLKKDPTWEKVWDRDEILVFRRQ